MAKQLQFQDKRLTKPKDKFGGALLKGNNPKTKRPLESKFPIHLVLRAKKGGMRLPKTIRKVNEIVTKTTARHGITVYKCANVGNHIHMVIKLSSVRRWASFIRELSGRIASLMRETNITQEKEGFWLHRPYSRIVRSWRKAYRDVKEYVHLNILEAEGFISRKETKTLKDLRAIWGDP